MSTQSEAPRSPVNTVNSCPTGRPKSGLRGPDLGLGIVAALYTIGPGDFISHSSSGAIYGYGLLWVVLWSVVCRIFWLNAAGKWVLIRGESILEGYARVGKWLVVVVAVITLISRHFRNLYKYPLMGECLDMILPLPVADSATVWALVTVIGGLALVYWGGYTVMESVFKYLMATMAVTMLAVFVLVRPDPGEIIRGMLIPSLPEHQGAYGTLLVIGALIGAETGSLAELSYCYYLKEKKRSGAESIRWQQGNLIFGSFLILLMAMMLQGIATQTLNAAGIVPRGTADLVPMFSGILGKAGVVVLAFGLWGAAFSGYVAGTIGSALIVQDAVRGVLKIRSGARGKRSPEDQGSLRRNDPLYIGCLLLWCVAPVYVLFTDWEPVRIVLVVTAAGIAAAPLMLGAALWITNRREYLGTHVNSPLTNLVIGSLALATVVCLYQAAKGWLQGA